jgi:hypothetical protein
MVIRQAHALTPPCPVGSHPRRRHLRDRWFRRSELPILRLKIRLIQQQLDADHLNEPPTVHSPLGRRLRNPINIRVRWL